MDSLKYFTKIAFLYIVLFIIPFRNYAQDCGCNHQITGNSDNVNIIDASSFDYSPGDVFCIAAGDYKSFRFIGFSGTADQPLIFKNCGGVVNIEGPTYTGISFLKSKYIHFTGTGSDEEYGIRINFTKSAVSGFAVADLSSDFEIDHLEIKNVGFAGIMAKTDPQCDREDTWRENFTLYNLKIHHNYIHDTEGEGMYIGGTFGYTSSKKECDGVERFAHELENVEIYENILERTGWDGIQVNLITKGADIHDNFINGYGTEKEFAQNQGMSIGAIKGRVYNNKIFQNPEYTTDDQFGMSIISVLDETYFYNNVIEGSGSYGIWMHQRLEDEYFNVNNGFYFINNTIIEPGKAGTFLNTRVPGGGDPRGYLNFHYINNLIVNPGIDYSNSGFWKGESESFFDFNDRADRDESDLQHNIMSRSIADLDFANVTENDFSLESNSTAIDVGMDVLAYGVTYDINDGARPFGEKFDVGAYEYGATNKVPVLVASVPESVIVNESFEIDGSESFDEDGSITFLWDIVGEENRDLIEFTDASAASTTALIKQEGNYIIRLILTDDLGASIYEDFEVEVNIPLGIESFMSHDYENIIKKFYPNPFTEKVTVILNDNILLTKARLYNSEGKLLYSYSQSELRKQNKSLEFNMSFIHEMVYIVIDGQHGQDVIKLLPRN